MLKKSDIPVSGDSKINRREKYNPSSSDFLPGEFGDYKKDGILNSDPMYRFYPPEESRRMNNMPRYSNMNHQQMDYYQNKSNKEVDIFIPFMMEEADEEDIMEYKDKKGDVKTDRYDPRIEYRGDRFDGKADRFYNKPERFEPKFDPKIERFDPMMERYENGKEGFEPKMMRYDPMIKRFEPPKIERYEQKMERYEPKYDRFESKTNERFEGKPERHELVNYERFDPRVLERIENKPLERFEEKKERYDPKQEGEHIDKKAIIEAPNPNLLQSIKGPAISSNLSLLKESDLSLVLKEKELKEKTPLPSKSLSTDTTNLSRIIDNHLYNIKNLLAPKFIAYLLESASEKKGLFDEKLGEKKLFESELAQPGKTLIVLSDDQLKILRDNRNDLDEREKRMSSLKKSLQDTVKAMEKEYSENIKAVNDIMDILGLEISTKLISRDEFEFRVSGTPKVEIQAHEFESKIDKDENNSDKTASETDSFIENLKKIPLEINRKRKSRKRTLTVAGLSNNEDGKGKRENKILDHIQQNVENYERMIKKMKIKAPASSVQGFPEERQFAVSSSHPKETPDYYPVIPEGSTSQAYPQQYPYPPYVYQQQMEYRNPNRSHNLSHYGPQSEYNPYHGVPYGVNGPMNHYMKYEDQTKIEVDDE